MYAMLGTKSGITFVMNDTHQVHEAHGKQCKSIASCDIQENCERLTQAFMGAMIEASVRETDYTIL